MLKMALQRGVKDPIVEPIVKIQSSVSEENLKQLEVLAKELAANTK